MYYNTKESGKRIKDLRKQRGITQEKLAEELGITREFVGRIETGKNGASVDLFVMLSQFFDVSLDYLILGRERKVKISENEKKMALQALKDLQRILVEQ